MTKRSERTINFQSIPGPDEGETQLTIYPPGTWFNEKGCMVFIGGCGVGKADTIEEAKKLLLDKSIEYCVRRIAEAEKTMQHYESERLRLVLSGLKPL